MPGSRLLVLVRPLLPLSPIVPQASADNDILIVFATQRLATPIPNTFQVRVLPVVTS